MKFLKGWFGEHKTTFNLWISLNSKTYYRFHNLIIPSRSGTAQIDHLIVSTYGVFIVETKNKKGWIFGSEYSSTWTQVLYNKKYTFQNPIRQAYRQKKVLSEFLNIEESLIETLVCFVGDCKFKTSMPENVLRAGLGHYIKSFKKQVLDSREVDEIIENIEFYKSDTTLSKNDHIKSLKHRHSSDLYCPWCGSNLVERISKKGNYKGKKFLGCESFPKCKFTKSL